MDNEKKDYFFIIYITEYLIFSFIIVCNSLKNKKKRENLHFSQRLVSNVNHNLPNL